MKLEELITVAKRYEDALHEHTVINHSAPAHTSIDICSHLHAEVSELFNVLRRKKAEHEGMTYEEGIIDELQDILCIWALAVNLLVPDADVNRMIENCTKLFRTVALKKRGTDIGETIQQIQKGGEPKSVKVDNLSWEPSSSVKEGGAMFKYLYKDEQKGLTTLFKFEKEGIPYNPFKLNGSANYFVMEGTLYMAGKEHKLNTFIHCNDGTIIDPVAIEVPCVVLCVYEKSDYIKAKIDRRSI